MVHWGFHRAWTQHDYSATLLEWLQGVVGRAQGGDEEARGTKAPVNVYITGCVSCGSGRTLWERARMVCAATEPGSKDAHARRHAWLVASRLLKARPPCAPQALAGRRHGHPVRVRGIPEAAW